MSFGRVNKHLVSDPLIDSVKGFVKSSAVVVSGKKESMSNFKGKWNSVKRLDLVAQRQRLPEDFESI